MDALNTESFAGVSEFVQTVHSVNEDVKTAAVGVGISGSDRASVLMDLRKHLEEHNQARCATVSLGQHKTALRAFHEAVVQMTGIDPVRRCVIFLADQ